MEWSKYSSPQNRKEKVLNAIKAGGTQKEIALEFEVSRSYVSKLAVKTGLITHQTYKGGRPRNVRPKMPYLYHDKSTRRIKP